MSSLEAVGQQNSLPMGFETFFVESKQPIKTTTTNLEREINRKKETIQRLEAELSLLESTLQLVKAAEDGDLENAKICMESTYVDVNYLVKDENGLEETPLMKASRKGALEFVQYLTENGAEVNTRNKEGVSSVYLAAQEGKLAVLRFLVEQGASKSKYKIDG